MIQLSVTIITYNEEANIGRCLSSVKGIADEVVVVDSYSTDATADICADYGVRFILHPFEGHIEQKNYALQQASHEWVLSLDADEVLSDPLIEAIQQLKKHHPKADAYSFHRRNNYCGQWINYCGWYPDQKLRLWNRSKGEWGGVNPHDKVVMQKDSNVATVKADILHYSFTTIRQQMDQINLFTEISSQAAYNKGHRSGIIKIIGKPIVKFLRDYIWKLGFLDGYYGFVICVNSAHAKFLKYTKLYALQRKE